MMVRARLRGNLRRLRARSAATDRRFADADEHLDAAMRYDEPRFRAREAPKEMPDGSRAPR